jgi:hypothetical protein
VPITASASPTLPGTPSPPVHTLNHLLPAPHHHLIQLKQIIECEPIHKRKHVNYFYREEFSSVRA